MADKRAYNLDPEGDITDSVMVVDKAANPEQRRIPVTTFAVASHTHTRTDVTSFFRGDHNASSNSFPSTGGSGTSGAILAGDMWRISAAGTLAGIGPANVGDILIARGSGNWSLLALSGRYVETLTSASLSGSDLAVTHNLQEQYPSGIQVYDDSDKRISPDNYTYVATNSTSGTFTFFQPITNTWRIVLKL